MVTTTIWLSRAIMVQIMCIFSCIPWEVPYGFVRSRFSYKAIWALCIMRLIEWCRRLYGYNEQYWPNHIRHFMHPMRCPFKNIYVRGQHVNKYTHTKIYILGLLHSHLGVVNYETYRMVSTAIWLSRSIMVQIISALCIMRHIEWSRKPYGYHGL